MMEKDDLQEGPRSLAEVAEHCPLSGEAKNLVNGELTTEQFLAQLIAREYYEDAIRVTAFNLSKREAVWWGALCLWEAHRGHGPKTLPKPVDSVFQTIVTWLQDPSERNRRTVETAGRDAGITTPHGQLAMAAFFSEGSMSLAGQPEVMPEPWLTSKNVASVVLAASRMADPSDITASQKLFLVLAAELSKGQLPWSSADEAKALVTAPTS